MASRRREPGYVLVTTAALLVVLCGFAALAVDMGLLYGARTAAQRAADAGALAGAFSFVANSLAPQPDTALAEARATAAANRILDVQVPTAEVTVGVDVAGRLVTVDVHHPVSTFFARVIGIPVVDVHGHAVAEASPVATAAACAKPWFMANTQLSTLGDVGNPNQPGYVAAPCNACNQGQILIQNGQVTAWARSLLGQQLRLKPGNPQNALAPGQFYAVAMADSRGGADYRTNIATCSPEALQCQQSYTVEPGNMIGPTKQGVNDLIGPSGDRFVAIGQYQRSDGTIGDTSPQLISVPVWDSCAMQGFCPSGTLPAQGRNLQIPIIGFAQIFLDGTSGNDVLGHLIGIAACSGAVGGGPSPGEIGPYALPVRLVRTQ